MNFTSIKTFSIKI